MTNTARRKKQKGNLTENIPRHKKRPVVWCVIIVGIIILIALSFPYPLDAVRQNLNSETNGFLFTFLMAILPLIGMPISIFLVLVGMIFGVTIGIVITGFLMLFHMTMTYYLVHSFLRPFVIKLLGETQMTPPQLPQRGKKRIAFLFMIIPGLPYTAKNYLLALTEISFISYLVIGWSTQFGLSIPFIIFGKGVMEMDPKILLIALILIFLGIAAQYYISRQRR